VPDGATALTDAMAAESRPLRAWRILGLVARFVVGGLFIYAAYGKILDPMQFAKEVQAYELVPLVATNAIAIVLPWIELVAGLLLVTGIWRAEARLLVFLMMLGFTFGKVSVEVRGMDIDCGCFGSDWMEKTFHGMWGIALNVFLVALLAVDHYSQRRCRRAMRAAGSRKSASRLAAEADS
jgi:uncharacterized membrane protein YphA (DoxX/SURF4 family)